MLTEAELRKLQQIVAAEANALIAKLEAEIQSFHTPNDPHPGDKPPDAGAV